MNKNKELDQLKKLKSENRRLKRQISELRKQIKRIEDWKPKARDLKAVIAKHNRENQEIEKQNKWLCHSCKKGTLSLVLFKIPGGMKYFRKCNACEKRTRMQTYHEEVEK